MIIMMKSQKESDVVFYWVNLATLYVFLLNLHINIEVTDFDSNINPNI